MTVALVGYRWDAERSGFFPDIEDAATAEWTGIDLRGDCTVPEGLAVVACSPDALRPGARVLADDVHDDAGWAHPARQRVGNLLGVTLDANRLADVLAELLIGHADDRRADRWNALRPTHRGFYEVWLGGERIVAIPRASGGAFLSENFNTANSTTLGPTYTWTENGSGMQIVSNHVEPSAIAQTDNGARAETDLDSSDMMSIHTLTIGTNTGHGASMACVRWSSSAFTMYGAGRRCINPAGNNLNAGKWVAGVYTSLGNTARTYALGAQRHRCYVSGSSILGHHVASGAETVNHTITATDTAITSGTRAGFHLFANTGVARGQLDNWSAMDLRTGRTIAVHDHAVHRASRW